MTDRSIRNPRAAATQLRAAAIQLCATADRERNLESAERLLRRAAAQGAELAVLPEKWAALGGSPQEDGIAAEWAAGIARELGIDLIAGSLRLRETGGAGSARGGGELLANVSLHFGPDGSLRARYAKLHMFDASIDGRAYRESEHEAPGDSVVVTGLAGGVKVGMSICYDVRFPELYRAMSAAGAELLSVPSAFTLATTRDHWEVLVRARAIENLCFVIAPNQVGEHGDGSRSGGRSLIVDPWGVVLAGASDGEAVLLADLDLAVLERVRRDLPALAHRREAAVYAEVRSQPPHPAGSR